MNEISNHLRSLKMPGMANCWTSLEETRQTGGLSLKDGLQLLIQAELDNRLQSRNARLLKKARFRYQASISEVIYDASRGIDKQTVLNLAPKLTEIPAFELVEKQHHNAVFHVLVFLGEYL